MQEYLGVCWYGIQEIDSFPAVWVMSVWSLALYAWPVLKEYYEIVDEARPRSGFFLHTCWFFLQKCISNHETKQSSKFQSWNINCWRQQFISLLSYCFFCIAFYTSSVVFWYVILWEYVCYRYNIYLRLVWTQGFGGF